MDNTFQKYILLEVWQNTYTSEGIFIPLKNTVKLPHFPQAMYSQEIEETPFINF